MTAENPDANKIKKSPKRALILSGGGARGAYEVGVVKGLIESGLDFHMLFGTSIGAFNAALIGQGSIARLEELWSTLSTRDIFRFPALPQMGIVLFMRRWGFLETGKFESLLCNEIDLKKLKNSNIQVGFVVTDLCTLKTRLITLDEISTAGELIDVLMAASALPLVFPPRPLKGKGLWIDGGLVRNTPIQAAINMGAEEIYTVLLHTDTINACPINIFQLLSRYADVALDASAQNGIMLVNQYNRIIESGGAETIGLQPLRLVLFQPRQPLGATLLDINPVRSRLLLQQGYEDAIEQLNNINATQN